MKTDVAIIGGGPGGTSAAMFLRRRGIRCTIVEKSCFPRYHIGESLTGECGNCLRELDLEEVMTSRAHPVKYGVHVYGPSGKNSFWVPVKSWCPERGLLDTFTWSVRRSDFDQMLLDGATSQGVDLVEGEAIEPKVEKGKATGLRVRTSGGAVEDITAEVLVDASGPATFLCNAGLTGAKSRGNYDKQLAIFSQVDRAIRDPGPASGNTLIFYRKKHHWAWFIPLDDEVTSVGVVVPTEYYRSTREDKHDFLVRELRDLNPDLSRRLPEIHLTEEVRGISNYSYHIPEFTGRGFLCVGDSHRFIDPVFSFGVFFSMKEGQQASAAIASYLEGHDPNPARPFADYQALSERGQDTVQQMIDAFWEEPYAFAFLAHQFHPDDIINIFAGRVYNDDPSPGQLALERILERSRRGVTANAVAN
jgi:flavin-dependent dehydrogenase